MHAVTANDVLFEQDWLTPLKKWFLSFKDDDEDDDDPENVDRGDTVEDSEEDDDADEPDQGKDSKDSPEKDDGGKGEEDESKDEDDEEDEEKESQKRSQYVPRNRFDSVNDRFKEEARRRQELEKEIEKLKEQNEAKGATQTEESKGLESDIKDAYRKYNSAIADNDLESALEIQERIHNLQVSQLREELSAELEKTSNKAVEQTRLDKMVDLIEEAYPQLNEDSKEFDQDAVNEVLELQDAFTAKGLSGAVALERAVRYVFPEPPPGEGGGKSKKKGLRSQSDSSTRKKADLVKKSPPTMKDVGKDNAHKEESEDITAMSEEEFEALPESKKRQLRGDTA